MHTNCLRRASEASPIQSKPIQESNPNLSNLIQTYPIQSAYYRIQNYSASIIKNIREKHGA